MSGGSIIFPRDSGGRRVESVFTARARAHCPRGGSSGVAASHWTQGGKCVKTQDLRRKPELLW